MLLLEIGVNIPGVPLLGLVDKRLQQVSTCRILWSASIGLGRGERFCLTPFVEQTGHTTRLRINLNAYELILQCVSRGLQKRVNNGRSRCCAYEISLISHRRSARQKQKVCPVPFRV